MIVLCTLFLLVIVLFISGCYVDDSNTEVKEAFAGQAYGGACPEREIDLKYPEELDLIDDFWFMTRQLLDPSRRTGLRERASVLGALG